MKIKGLLHVHSNFSDGELSLREIKEKAQRLGMRFVFMADHLSWIEDQSRFEKFLKECQKYSDEGFLMIPGYEVETKEGFHVLVYNVKSLVKNHLSFIDLFNFFSERKDSFFVLAHASQAPKRPPQTFFEKIDGVEVWSSKYDSRYAPNLRSLKWAKEENLLSLVGSDAHGSAGLKKLWIELNVEKLEVKDIINSLKKKDFLVKNNLFSINLNSSFNFFHTFYFRFINLLWAPIRIPLVFLTRKGVRAPRIFKKIFHKFY
jgi:histidinol phosphatase-like PHP family hydrolase